MSVRVCYLVHRFLPEHAAGTEVYTDGLARRAIEAGHEVQVLAHQEARPGETTTASYRYGPVPVRVLRANLGDERNVARAEYDAPRRADWVRAALTAWAPDVVHVTHALQFGFGALAVASDLGLPLVVTLADYWFLCPRSTLLRPDNSVCDGPSDPDACVVCMRDLHGLAGRRGEVRAIRHRSGRAIDALARADRVVCLTGFLADRFAANGFDTTRFEVVPHGPEAAHLRHGERRRGERVRFVVAGGLSAHKGTALVIEAFRAEPDLDAELVVFGSLEGSSPESIRVVEAAQADGRVTVAGRYEPGDLGRVVASADYLLAPSLAFDNAPMVVRAALHIGVPVVASDLGTLAEMVRDGETGWLVPPGDLPAWRTALRRAVDQRDRWSGVGRAQVTAEDHAARILAIYDEVRR